MVKRIVRGNTYTSRLGSHERFFCESGEDVTLFAPAPTKNSQRMTGEKAITIESVITTAATAMTSPPPAGDGGDDVEFNKSSNTILTKDYLSLVGFAAQLGTCVNNDVTSDYGQEDAKTVRDEAMLLMSLLMGEKAEEILSDVKESRGAKRRRRGWSLCPGHRPQDGIGIFSFTFPSLSLQPYDGNAVTATAQDELAFSKAHNTDEKNDRPWTPSQLLGRVQSVHEKDLLRDSSETMAHNVLESFGAALVWRAKAWIKSLADVLALKEQKRIDALKALDEEDGVKVGTDQYEEDADDDDLINSKEMQIIDAIVKSSEEVSVVNIKTSFRVLSNRVSHFNGDVVAEPTLGPDEEPTSKWAKTDDHSPQEVFEYKLTHKLMFEATISMTSNDGVRYNGVKIQAPGHITGTFANKPVQSSPAEDGEHLMAVSITLDTDALALSLETQSRLVVRRAAEAVIMSSRSTSGGDSSNKTIHSPNRENDSVISPRYVLMSPFPQSFSQFSSDGEMLSIPPGSEFPDKQDGERAKSPVVSDEDTSLTRTSFDTTPSSTPTEEINDSQSSLPALLSVVKEELIRGD